MFENENLYLSLSRYTCLAPIVMFHAAMNGVQHGYQAYYMGLFRNKRRMINISSSAIGVSTSIHSEVKRVLVELRGATFAMCLVYMLHLYTKKMASFGND